MESLAELEAGRKNKELYSRFIVKYVSKVIGVKIFAQRSVEAALVSYCTVSDEAFAFLVLKNNWELYTEMSKLEKGMQKGRNCKAKAIFFADAGRGYSYNLEGRINYNKKCQEIKRDRQLHGVEFDKYFLEQMTPYIGRQNDGYKGEGATKRQKREQAVRCYRDHEGDDIYGMFDAAQEAAGEAGMLDAAEEAAGDKRQEQPEEEVHHGERETAVQRDERYYA